MPTKRTWQPAYLRCCARRSIPRQGGRQSIGDWQVWPLVSAVALQTPSGVAPMAAGPPDALNESIDRRKVTDQSIEVEIEALFSDLRCHHDLTAPLLRRGVLARPQEHRPFDFAAMPRQEAGVP